MTKGERLALLGALGALVLLPGGAVVATVIVRRTKARRDFMRTVGAEVLRQLGELRPDLLPEAAKRAAAIVAAQASVETGDGKTQPWVQGFNFGNVTAGASWHGDTVSAGDTEPDASGKYVPIVGHFRKYGSVADAVQDFLTGVLNWRRERDAGVRDALFAGDLDAYAERLRLAGYYTAPLATYQGGIRARLPVALEALA